MTAETVTEVVEYAGIALHIGVPGVGVCAEGRYAHTARAGSAGSSRWHCIGNDRRSVMPPAPVVARETSAFARGGRPR